MNAPGLTLALTSAQGPAHSAAYGYADIAAKIPVATAHVFEIGSISKSFVGVMILQLHEEGKLDLHKPILHYLPWLAMEMEHGELTIHQLLTHSSGMPSEGPIFPVAPGSRPRQSFDRPMIRRSCPRPIENQQLMFEQKRVGGNGTSTAAAKEFGNCGDEMDKQDDPRIRTS